MPISAKRWASAQAIDFTQITRGVEKESLRITPKGGLAQTPHPQSLGSALTHPHITTDFSEALLEFITAPSTGIESTLEQLDNIHRFTYANIDDEMLWVNSMPCVLNADAGIPVARYGSAHVARMKTIYRLGLGHRYGRPMQTIAGIHYNFSLPKDFWRQIQLEEGDSSNAQDFRTQGYFHLIRNFRRYFWLLLYLFGASPAICPTFVQGRRHKLTPLTEKGSTLHGRFATSLRMGDLGYQSSAQQGIRISYNSLPDYLQALCRAITQSHPDYESIGLKDKDGHYQQLNTGILQIENEFYSTVRPKRSAKRGETALRALFDRGVEYVEVRCVDLDPFSPLGINAEQIRFLDTFLLYCALADSPLADADENRRVHENQQRIVYSGRDPELSLTTRDGERPFAEWAGNLLDDLAPIAELLDDHHGSGDYCLALDRQKEKVSDADLTPSAQVLQALVDNDQSFYQFGMEWALKHHRHFQAEALAEETQATFVQLAAQSIQDQRSIEEKDSGSFADYLAQFYQQYQYCNSCD